MRPSLDALIVTRGGGSQDDIACFNDERVVRAVFQSPLPIVSAVGHEIDVTLCDLAADVRALTPSQAGELIVPDGAQIAHRLEQWSARLRAALKRRADVGAQRLAAVARHPTLRRPLDRLQLTWQRCDQLGDRLARGLQHAFRRHESKTSELAARLQAISPIQVLQRGYSLTLDQHHRPIVDALAIPIGSLIETQVARGSIRSRVEHRQSDNWVDAQSRNEN
jgi:exodeoxyribonuclease VII large subunit